MKSSDNLETAETFLSYNSKDKVIAGRVKESLEQFGVGVFLAHSDLEGGVQWEHEIVNRIRTCDVFLAFLTSQFRDSRWTDQEVGVGIASSRFIIPLSVKGLKPHGFLARYQAFKFDIEALDRSCRKVLFAMKNNKKVKEKVQNSFIESFVKSDGFIEANQKSELLEEFGPYSGKQVNRILQGYLRNSQIHKATIASKRVREFLSKNRRLIRATEDGKVTRLSESELERLLSMKNQ